MSKPSENVPQTLPLPPSGTEEEKPPATVAGPPSTAPGRSPPAAAPPSTQMETAATLAEPRRPAEKPDRTEAISGPSSDSFGTQALTPSACQRPEEFTGTLPLSEGPAAAAAFYTAVLIPGYDVLSELGRGGMGVVYKARQLALNRLVALKMILSGQHAGRQEMARFKAEAEAIARLQHPNIVQIYDVGEHEGRPYFSLEFLEGGSLADKLKGEPMPFRQAGQLIEVLARAMHAAHQAQIVHRDLKPGNILLGRKPSPGEIAAGALPLGAPKITDFGLAKKLDEQSSQTQSGSVLGTPNYMAPEQAAGKVKEVGPLADVYALGAILYELLTGRPPFKGEGAWDTVKQVLNEEPLPPSRLRRGLPRDLETLCLRCLQKEPAKRYGSALELAEDLRRWLDGQPIHARPVSGWERMVKWARRNPAVAGLSATVAAALAGILVLLFILWRHTAVARDVAVAEKVEAVSDRDRAKEQEEAARKLKEKAEQEYDRARREGYASQLNLAQIALQEARFDRASQLLAELKKRKPGEADLRGFEWFYLWDLSHSKLTLRGHTNLVSGLVFSPDGTRMTTASLDGSVKVWDGAKGTVKLSLDGHKGPVRTVAYSADGKRLATGGEDGTVRLWDADTGKELAVFNGHTGFVTAAAFSADGRSLASAGEDRIACVWDLSSGTKSDLARPRLTLTGHRYGLTSIAFRPNGQQIATGSWDRTVRLWNAATGVLERELKGHTHWVRTVGYSPDGKQLATGSWDRTVKLWDPGTGEHLRTLAGYETPVEALSYAPDGQRLATLTLDQSAQLWDLSLKEDRPQRIGSSGPVRGVSFSSDGQLIASVRFDFTGKGQEGAKVLDGHKSSVLAVAFQPRSKENVLASAGADGTVKLWKPETEELFRTLTGHEGPVRSLAFSGDGSLLAAGGEDGTVHLWDAEGRLLRILRGHTGWVTGLSFSADARRLASGSEDRSIRVWDLAAKERTEPLLTLQGHAEGVQALAYSPDAKRIVAASGDGLLHFWDAQSGKEGKPLPGKQGQVRSLAFSPDGKTMATAGWDGVVMLRSPATGAPIRELRGHTYGVTSVVFSADGKRLASSSEDRTAKLWDLASGRELLTLTGHAAGVTCAALSGDGLVLASSCWDQKVRVWQAPRGE